MLWVMKENTVQGKKFINPKTLSWRKWKMSLIMRRRMIRISVSLNWSRILMELIFNSCSEFRWSPEGPVSQIHSPHLHAGAHGIFSDFLRSVKMLKREWGAESNGRLPHLFILSKTATTVPEFPLEILPLGRIAALVSEFALKDLHLGRTFSWWWWCAIYSYKEKMLYKIIGYSIFVISNHAII